MPVIILLTFIILCLLFLLRRLSSENKELKQKVLEDMAFLQQLQTQDTLTQVMSRQQFMSFVELEFQRAKRNEQPLSLIACDLDYFYDYQQHYGNFMADESLFAIAQAIDGSVKRAGECVGRVAWEKFWILLPNVPEDKAIALAKIIQTAVRKLDIDYEHSPGLPTVTLSMGIVSFIPTAEDELPAWMRSVEMAVETAKDKGGDRYYVAK